MAITTVMTSTEVLAFLLLLLLLFTILLCSRIKKINKYTVDNGNEVSLCWRRKLHIWNGEKSIRLVLEV